MMIESRTKQKDQERQRLQRDLRAFLKRGGKIHCLTQGQTTIDHTSPQYNGSLPPGIVSGTAERPITRQAAMDASRQKHHRAQAKRLARSTA